MEIWRNIEGYENLYQISSEGRVKSLGNGNSNNSKEKILKSCKDGGGYLFVRLYKEKERKTFKVHRLVAQAFIPNPNNYPIINHKDENPSNNKVKNLEWCDSRYNNNYGTHNERMAKALSIPILQFSKTGEFIKRWDSATQVERELGVKNNNINPCLKGRRKSAGGYKWGYADDYERIPFKVFNIEIFRKKVT